MEQGIQPCALEVTELQQQLQSSERERQTTRQQLARKEAELGRAEETIRSEREQRQQRERELAQTQQQLRDKVNLSCNMFSEFGYRGPPELQEEQLEREKQTRGC